MKKIFGILVVLMMVAGTFVSCNMPTNDSTGAETSVKGKVIAESSDGALCIVSDERGEMFFCTKAASIFEGYYSNAGYKSITIMNGSIKNFLPVQDNYLHVSDKEFNTYGDNAAFDGDILKIHCSELSPSNGIQTLTYNGHTLQYKIN